MQIKYNVTGDRRKALVAVMRDVLQDTTRYLGAPSFAFQVGAYTIDMLIRELAHDGFVGERIGATSNPSDPKAAELDQREQETPHIVDFDHLAIELLKDGMTPTAMENLRRLVASKATLLKKALDTDSLAITEHSDRIEFGWFRPTDDQAEISAYYQLVQGLCDLARTQKRGSATEQKVENDKYTFRCFLLRLGFIGENFKESRRILLKNLSGNSAFRTAREAGDEE